VTTAYDDDDAIEAEVVEQTARIVQLRKTLPPPLALEAATEPEPASRARDLVKRVARPLPGPKRIGRVTLWWTLHLAMVLPWLPKLAFQELWPIGRGVRIVCSGWANWVQATRRHEYAKEAEGNTKTKYGTAAEKTAVARKWGSAAFAAILAGVGVWLWNTHPGYLLVAGILALAGLDLLGRADTPVQKSAPAMPRVLSENVPLRQVEASVLAALEREGFPEGSVAVAEPMWWDETRRQYEISLSLADQLRPEHLRAVERAIGARDHAIRNLATDTATVRRLVIVVGDPLAALSERPFIPTGTRSIVQPVELGESMTEVPFALPSAGVHWRVVAGTGGAALDDRRRIRLPRRRPRRHRHHQRPRTRPVARGDPAPRVHRRRGRRRAGYRAGRDRPPIQDPGGHRRGRRPRQRRRRMALRARPLLRHLR
jgi:hypothetical protein